ncbi:hypothetical protein O4J55_23820, partial [Paracoccus sp. PXZ]
MGMKTGPSAANTVRKNLSTLFNFAIRKEWLMVNPAKKAMARKENDSGYHSWTEDEISRFLDKFGPGPKQCLALVLILCTRQDMIRPGWQDIKAGRISYRRGKTGQAADLPILPELWAELDGLPRDVMLFLNHGGGRPYKPESFANWFKAQCIAAGLLHCFSLGSRKAGATRLAYAGATDTRSWHSSRIRRGRKPRPIPRRQGAPSSPIAAGANCPHSTNFRTIAALKP